MATSPWSRSRLPKMDVRISYTIDNRDNQSPRNAYAVDTRSNTSTSANGDCSALTGLCLNLPFSFEHQILSAEAGYRILPQTKVTLNDTFDTTFRSYADASFVTSNTVTGQDPQPVGRRTCSVRSAIRTRIAAPTTTPTTTPGRCWEPRWPSLPAC